MGLTPTIQPDVETRWRLGIVRLGVFRNASKAHDPSMEVVVCESHDGISWRILLVDYGQKSPWLENRFIQLTDVLFRNVYDWPYGLKVGGYFR